MAILLLLNGRDPAPLQRALQRLAPRADIRIWPDTGQVEDIGVAVCWQHPYGALSAYPKLRLIASYGAGVDHILGDPALPAQAAISRLEDPGLGLQIGQYILWAILEHRLDADRVRAQQVQHHWQSIERQGGNRVGILGLGKLGAHTAEQLARHGFEVYGWSRGEKSLAGVECLSGEAGLNRLLARADYLVCLLPLTPGTRDILSAPLFARLPLGAYLINAARGEHLDEAALLTALAEGKLSGACLDVVRDEPLPADSPLWDHPRIRLTPHLAGLSDLELLARQVVENAARLQDGRPLQHLVSRSAGY